MKETGLWIHQDGAQIVRDYLRKYTDSPEMFVAVIDNWDISKPPKVSVVTDAIIDKEGAWSTEQVRITTHAKDIPTARKIMTTIDSMLLSPYFRLKHMTSITPASSIIAIQDSKLGGAGLASCVYNVNTHRIVRDIKTPNLKHRK